MPLSARSGGSGPNEANISSEGSVSAEKASQASAASVASITRGENFVPLPKSRMLAFVHLRVIMSAWDLTLRPARFAVYSEALKMSPATQATVVAAAKAMDLVVGFVVGKVSDTFKSRWGRRRPFVAFCLPISMLSLILFCSPQLFFEEQKGVAQPCSEHAADTDACPALQSCLQGLYNTSVPVAGGSVSESYVSDTGMLIYFATFYSLFHFAGWTGVGIPWDAWALELTDDRKERTTLFGFRAAAQMLGYTLPIGLQMGLNSALSSNVPLQYSIMSIVFGIWGLLSGLNLLCCVGERVHVDNSAKDPVPFVVAVRRIMGNKPYRTYLQMRCAICLCTLLPSNLIQFYAKFVVQRENYVALVNVGSALYLLGALLAVPPVAWLTRRYSANKVLATVLVIQTVSFGIVFFFPAEMISKFEAFVIFCMFIAGCASSSGFMIPDVMLAEIIDYDELLTGERREAMFTTVEVNMVQFVEIIGGVLPLLLLEATMYEPNGGCSCGCGIDCETKVGMPYARWHCPQDIAFSCTGDVDSPLLFGDPNRSAPCLLQPASVRLVIRLFFAGLPALMGALAVLPLIFGKNITPRQHRGILRELDARQTDATHVCNDLVVTGEPIVLPSNAEHELALQHFSKREQRLFSRLSKPGSALRAWTIVCAIASTLLAAGVITGAAASGSSEMLPLGVLLMAGLLLLAVWNVLRCRGTGGLLAPETAAASGGLAPAAAAVGAASTAPAVAPPAGATQPGHSASPLGAKVQTA